jgi:hypothetical protein
MGHGFCTTLNVILNQLHFLADSSQSQVPTIYMLTVCSIQYARQRYKARALLVVIRGLLRSVQNRAPRTIVSALLAFGTSAAQALEPEIRFAGYGFIADVAGAQVRFPVLCRILGESCNANGGGRAKSADPLDRHLAATVINLTVSGAPGIPKYRIVGTDGDSRSADSLVMAVAFSSEGVEVQRVEDRPRTTYSLWAQLLFFDFQSRTLRQSYPLRLQHTVLADPSEVVREQVYREMLFGGSNPATFSRALPDALARLSISRSIQWVGIESPIAISEAAKKSIPGANEAKALSEDLGLFLQAELSERLNLSVLPYLNSQAISKMRLKFSNQDAWGEINLPEPTFKVSLLVRDLRKAQEEQRLGTVIGYGAFTTFKVVSPVFNETALEDTRVRSVTGVPLYRGSNMSVDDWPSHRANLFSLIARFTQQLKKPDSAWIRDNVGPEGAEARIRALRSRLKIAG